MQSSSQPSFYNPGLGFSFDVAGSLSSLAPSFSQPLLGSQGSSSAPLSSADLNSPELFKQNIQLVLTQITRVQVLARSALGGIEQAYHPGVNPLQTVAAIGDLKQVLLDLVDALRVSGVGALPLDVPPVADTRTEEQLLAEATRAVQALYERQRRIQEGANVVANLLGTADGPPGSQGAGSQNVGSQGSGRRI
ncbi:hypothetical protein C8Q77DRAFT_1054082 [Trametes polyzona]|nr:hypothetical protein C8Q77DRAFT_1054082 [Trametes polyzona]